MTNSEIRKHPDAGFINLTTVLVVIVVVIGIAAAATDGFSGSMTKVSRLLNLLSGTDVYSKAASISQGIGMKQAEGYDISLIDLTTQAPASSTRVALYDPIDGAISKPNMQAKLFVERPASVAEDDWGNWLLFGNTTTGEGTMQVADVGTTAAEWVIIVPGLQRSYCQAINKELLQFDEDDAPPQHTAISSSSLYSALAETDKVSSLSGTLTAVTPANVLDGKTRACLATTDNDYFFYSVVAAR
ncbi:MULTISPECIES: hypothetical protein [Alphaproteobacteria]|uniref:hypothetical protein n=1 Tax=Alphaproteobacteria TaxID=28211 RepID=UPI003265DF1A